MGAHPQGAVAGDHLLLPQALQGLQLLGHRLVGGGVIGDLGANGRLLFANRLPLAPQGIGIAGHQAAARCGLVDSIQAGH